MLNSSNPIQYTPPKESEFEISLFGPGVGECIVIHIGYNEWVIVDSFLEASTKRPAPLSYLNKLGINPCDAVKLFVISHWHSDHIRGAAQITTESPNATICLSEALLKEEFLTLVAAYSGLGQCKLLDRHTNATNEMAMVICAIKNRIEKKNGMIGQPIILASSDKRIHRNGSNCEIWALSPSSKSILNSLIEIKQLIPSPSEEKIRNIIPAPAQNHNSIVLWIKCDDATSILLGSDLEETNDPLTGWSVIIDSNNRPDGKSKLFKIPHHGSKTGHSDMVWSNIVEKDAICLLTTKIGGRNCLPKNQDITRLKSYSNDIYCTGYQQPKKIKYHPTVEKTIKGVLKRRIPLNSDAGHIQVRYLNGQFDVRMNKIASKL